MLSRKFQQSQRNKLDALNHMFDIPFLELRGLEANLPMKALKAQTAGFQNVSRWCECFPKQNIIKNNQNLGFKM